VKLPLPAAPTLLLLLCAGLAAGLVREINRPARGVPVPEATVAASVGEAPHGPPPFVAPPPPEFAEVAARPVFAATRRPPLPPPVVVQPTPVAVPPPPPAPPPVAAQAITVLGIAGGPAQRIALLQPPNVSTVLAVVEGESIAGWRVVKILADRVVLRWNATEEEISFPKSAGKAAMPTPAFARPPANNNRHP
jgi:hypothetical protein